MAKIIGNWGVPLLGLIAAIVGSVLLAQPRSSSFGWFAYAPLSGTTFAPAAAGVVPGVLLLAIGLVLVAGWVGFAVGRRIRK